ncbi:MAG: FAD-dependent oxidoreductase [Candidatus Methylomirabilales bacterium]
MQIRQPCDVLVIGGGGAALRAAIAAKEVVSDVVLCCKEEAGRSGSTMYAGCSMIAALPTDPPEAVQVHFKDTMAVGKFLNDEALVEELVTHAGVEIPYLENFGVKLHIKKGDFLLGKGPDAVLPSGVEPDYTGYDFAVRGMALTHPLAVEASRRGVEIVNHVAIIKLALHKGEVFGAVGVDLPTGKIILFPARAVILASGGGGWLYAQTSNSPDLTGDSFSLALEAGVRLRDMEFVEFNPCRLLYPDMPTNLPPDLFSYGGVLRNTEGDRFILKHNPKGEEASFREEMPRLLAAEVDEGRGVQGGVWLDATAVPSGVWEDRYPFLYQALLQHDVDPRKEFLIFGVRANLFTGGVEVRLRGRTERPGLFAAGEAVGGVHGAKRFGGNSVAHAIVSGALVGKEAAQEAKRRGSLPDLSSTPVPRFVERAGPHRIGEIEDLLRRVMWENVGLVRSEECLRLALEAIQSCQKALVECGLPAQQDQIRAFALRGMLLTAEAVTRSALERRESRGPHYRDDFQAQDRSWLGSVEVRQSASGLDVAFTAKEKKAS